MKIIVKMTLGLIFITLLLAACSSSPAANPPTATAAPVQDNTPTATSVPQVTPTTSSYPAPSDTTTVVVSTPAGYPFPTPVVDTPVPQKAYPPPGGLILITADGNQEAIDPNVVSSVAQKDVTIDGQQMQLRALTDLINMIGVTSYNQVTAENGGAPLVLSKDQVSQAYLDVKSDETIRLVVQGIPQDQWLTNLTTLQIN